MYIIVAGGTPRVVKIDDIAHALHVHALLINLKRGHYRGVTIMHFCFRWIGLGSEVACLLGRKQLLLGFTCASSISVKYTLSIISIIRYP